MLWERIKAVYLCKAVPQQQAGRTMPGVSLRDGEVLENAHSRYAGRHIAAQACAALPRLLQCLEDLRMSLSQATLDAIRVNHRPGLPCGSEQDRLQACLESGWHDPYIHPHDRWCLIEAVVELTSLTWQAVETRCRKHGALDKGAL